MYCLQYSRVPLSRPPKEQSTLENSNNEAKKGFQGNCRREDDVLERPCSFNSVPACLVTCTATSIFRPVTKGSNFNRDARSFSYVVMCCCTLCVVQVCCRWSATCLAYTLGAASLKCSARTIDQTAPACNQRYIQPFTRVQSRKFSPRIIISNSKCPGLQPARPSSVHDSGICSVSLWCAQSAVCPCLIE